MSFYRQDFTTAVSNGPLSSITSGSTILSGGSPATSSRIGPPFFMVYDNAPHVGAAGVAAAGADATDELKEELWQACAGPLVYVPQKGDRVWYFPQGHMEQVTASTNPKCRQKLPHPGLDSQILCRVVTRDLSAEPDTDEVFAHVSLLPIPLENGSSLDEAAQESVPAPPRSSVRLFTKILTASDTSTHGGFSVLRKHAEDCLPPLDMSQDPPTQDLVARDLHGKEWPFKHTYRGHPRRHLLTTGWSVFVSHKRLMAGDAVIFLRGENGQLRVGIRRAKRQPAVQQAVMSNISMHMGVVATARHAVATRTIFSAYYKPRVSLSAFLVPVEKFAKTMSMTLSVGMRFKMRFETEDASDRSYVGTITGIEDLDTSSFPDSKWRSLKINWDEMVTNERPEKVSPWEIELAVASPAVNPPPPLRTKRVRPSPINTSAMTALSALGAGSGMGSLECTFTSRPPRVSQGQDSRNVGINSVLRSSPHGLSSMQEALYPHHHTSISQQLGSMPIGQSLPLPSPRASFYSPFMSGLDADFKFHRSSVNVHGATSHHSLLQGSPWPPAPSNEGSTKWLMSLRPQHSSTSPQIQQEKSLVTGNVLMPPPPLSQQQHPLAYPNFSPFPLWETHKQEIAAPPTPVVAESGCKLFGISLTDISASAKAIKPNKLAAPDCEDATKGDVVHAQLNMQGGSETDAQKHIKSDASSEQDRADHNALDSRTIHSTRSRIKVIKKGTMIGRGIDLSRFDSYNCLLQELEVMFNMEGELTDPSKGWHVAYYDGEGDTMKVGDDPWPEFCSMVKKLYIISPEEVEQGGNHTTMPKEVLQGQVG
ncbi:hypothetical protein GOP47_0018637 [Adiantum capillus-veneris]|uniref:Auxin response factor n=1 Tax=Adiantum capillus-veneris TaxID=13818 RepID=A0A9D4UDJ5_ADICA|nr:hypothetical protein GOP47_0018637 [Adiantum capillus-veneris]